MKIKSLKNSSFSVKKLRTIGLNFLQKVIGLEAVIWISALFFLAVINNPNDIHFSICPLNNLGIEFCPGCGLGNSISYIFHGEIYKSFITHPLGIFALVVLFIRIIKITKNNWRNYGKHFTANALS